MNRTASKTALVTAVAFAAGFTAQTASADLIDVWDYEVDATYTDFTPTDGVTGSNPNDKLGGSTTLSWGTPANSGGEQSSVSVDPDSIDTPAFGGSAPLLETGGDSESGASFIHDNNVITADSPNLSTFNLQTQINLVANTPDNGGTGQAGPVTFNGFFTETFNEADVDDCVEGSTSACDDIFVLTNTDVGLSDGAFTVSDSFVVDDYRYTVFLDIEDLGVLTDDQCDAAGANSGCIGFLTEEDATTTFDSTFRITATQVPEPGSLALLGLGLAGFGYARRRARKA